MALNKVQTQHIQDLLAEISGLVVDKYTRGAEEHDSNLLDMSPEDLLDEAICESIDQIVYLLTLREKLGVCESCGCNEGKHYPTCETFTIN